MDAAASRSSHLYQSVNEPLTQKQQEIANSYINATPDMRKVILLAEKDYPENIAPIYQHYFRLMKDAIDVRERTDTHIARLAQNVLKRVQQVHESPLQKYELTRVSDDKLFDVLHAATDLLNTRIEGEGGEISRDFTIKQDAFIGSIQRLKSNARINALKCAGYGLIAAVSLIAAVVIAVFTFGGSVPMTFNSVALGLINVGGEAGLGIYLAGSTFKFFNEAVKSQRIAHKMDKLNDFINEQKSAVLTH